MDRGRSVVPGKTVEFTWLVVGQVMAFSPEVLLAAGVAGTENHVCVCVVYAYSEVSSSCPGI